MPRSKLWYENINVSLARGSKAAMDAARRKGETRLDLIRMAIKRELKRREKAAERRTVAEANR